MNGVQNIAKLPELWARARAGFARLVADLLTAAVLTPRQQHYVRGRVGYLERIVRKLLFAEAAALAPLPSRQDDRRQSR